MPPGAVCILKMNKFFIFFALIFSLSLTFCPPGVVYAQAPAQNSAPLKPEELAEQWFTRLNDLDDWYISFDNVDENKAVVDRFIELYAEDAYHQVGPNENQIGQVVYRGRDGIRKWADE